MIALYVFALVCITHPRVTTEYREFYIDHVASDWHPTRYSATPQDGILFSAPGLPTFVEGVYGLSYRESWGRWTDAAHGPVARVSFVDAMKGPICMELKAQASEAEKNLPVEVVFGEEQRAVLFDRPDFSDYFIDFSAVVPADSVSFKFAGPVPPADDVNPKLHDSRRLGLALVSLKILPGPCVR